jgi:LDH2 family malate/lactate/ureidoglycolate dehydrogenase
MTQVGPGDISQVYKVRYDRLRPFVAAVLEWAQLPTEDAAFVAEVLTEADLRGVESHGVTRLAGYLGMIDRGYLNPHPAIEVVQDTGACALLDGDLGFGMLGARQGMCTAMDKAKEYGIGMVTARNLTHTGLVGYYTMMAANSGLIGWAMNNGPTIVPPFGGLTPTYATNPISIAFPGGEEEPVVLDMATTMVAAGKLRLAAKKGAPIPTNWGTDREGIPTDDPGEVLSHGHLQWAGGYKGFGLGTVIELMTGVLSGGLFGLSVPPLRDFGQDPLMACGTYIAIDIERFIPLEDFRSRLDELVRQIKSSKRAAGVDRIYVAGEIEFEQKRERLQSGIPLSKAVFDELKKLSEDSGTQFDLIG